MSEVRSLVHLSEATRLLAEARTVDDVKTVRDQAEAMRIYARERDLGLEAQNHAAEIKIRAERRLGELLAEMPRHPPGPDRSQPTTDLPPTLKELGVTKDESSRWQRMAGLDEDTFEQHIAEVRAANKELTTAGVERLVATQRTLVIPESGSLPLRTLPLLRFCQVDMPTATLVSLILRVMFPDADTALDMTYGSGAFWDGSAHVRVAAAHDVDPSRAPDGPVDFRALPYDDDAFDVTLFDPPHLADAGEDSIMGQRFGSYPNQELRVVIAQGAAEAWRVGRLGCVVKISDHVHGQQFQRETGWVISAIGTEPYDVVHQTRSGALVNPRWEDQLSAYNNGSTYLIFRRDGPLHVRRAR